MPELVRGLARRIALVAFAATFVSGTAFVAFGISVQRTSTGEMLQVVAQNVEFRLRSPRTIVERDATIRAALAETARRSLQLSLYDASGRRVAGNPNGPSISLPFGPEAVGLRNYVAFPIPGGYGVVSVADAYVVTRLEELALLIAILSVAVGAFAFAGTVLALRPVALTLQSIGDVWRRFADGKLGGLTVVAPAGGLLRDFVGTFDAATRRIVDEAERRADADERMRSFVADAGHELKTPLAVISGYLTILRRGALREPDVAERIVETMAAEDARMRALIDNLLHLARLDMHPPEAEERVNASVLALEAVDRLRPLVPEREIAVDAAEDAWVLADPDELREAVKNVIDNAIAHAAPSPVRVAVERCDAPAEVTIDVRDWGPGMSTVERAHAFERFFRGPRRGEVPGSGLGLAIAKSVVEQAGGSISLETEPGGGTAVRIRLPAAP